MRRSGREMRDRTKGRWRLIHLGLALALISSSSPAFAEVPTVDASVAVVSSGPFTEAGRYRLVVSVSEIYHHVFVQWITYGPEGSGAKIASEYAVSDEELGGWKYSVKMLSNLEWVGSDKVRLRVNDRRNCEFSLKRESYAVVCE